jgi:ferrochelatase
VHGRGEKLVMSFHGVPKRTLNWATPTTANATRPRACWRRAWAWAPDEYLVTFQSRFGRAEWLQPYTAPTVQQLAREGASAST